MALISLPWNLAERPNFPLGALKGYLLEKGIQIDVHHLHLMAANKLGMARYHRIAVDWHLGEALYSALFAPQEKERILSAYRSDPRIEKLLVEVRNVTLECLAEIDLFKYDMVGFSVAHLQLMSSLYAARHIKSLKKDITVIFGGRGVSGAIGESLLTHNRDIDIVVNGEGELPLLHLCKLPIPLNPKLLHGVPNIFYRSNDDRIRQTHTEVLPDLNSHPAPDFTEFYVLARALGHPAAETVLPIEASRGCAWEHRGGVEKPDGCAFCGLNSGWPNYRQKPLAKVMEEIFDGVAKYQVLDIAFVDSCLPESYRDELLERLIAANLDITLFCELRPDFSARTASLLARAGTRKVQIGIEAFSTTLLKRLGKGVRAIDNVYRMKLCSEHNIPFQYNLLTHIPGTKKEEIDETIVNIAQLFAFQPPHVVPFFLARGSRMHSSPGEFGIAPESVGRGACAYLPAILADAGVTEDVPYHCSASDGIDALWDQIVRLVEIWRQFRDTVGAVSSTDSPLFYRCADNFVAITDLRQTKRVVTLESTDRDIFLACRSIREIESLESEFSMDRRDIVSHVDALEEQGLVMREDSLVLALPVRAPLPRNLPRKDISC